MKTEIKKYQELGFSLIPIWHKAKNPALSELKPYLSTKATSEEIDRWFSGSKKNVGTTCGPVSGLLVVDVDQPEHPQLKEIQLPATASVKTGKGYHLYYKMDPIKPVRNMVFEWGELRGEGGYAVLPPSIHPSGIQYEWNTGLPESVQDFTPFPYELLKYTKRTDREEKSLYNEFLEGSVTEGARNNMLTSFAGKIMRHMDPKGRETLALPMLLNANQAQCEPALTATEVKSIYNSVNSYCKQDVEELEKLFNPITLGEFLSMDFPDTEWWIDGLIPKNAVTILASESGVAKTWIALALSLVIAQGGKFLQDDKYDAEQGKVLYLDAEMGPRELQRRCKMLGFEELDIKDNFYLLNSYDFNLNSDETVSILRDFIHEHNIEVVFMDTLRPFASGINENEGTEVRAFFQRFYSLRDDGVSVVVLDHNRKRGQGESKRPSKDKLVGSQDKMASVDVAIMLHKNQKKYGEDSDGQQDTTQIIEVHQVKNRYRSELAPFGFEMGDTSDKTRVYMKPAEIATTEENKLEIAQDYIIELLEDHGNIDNARMLDLMKENYKIGKTTTEKARKKLLDNELISRKKEGKKFTYFLPEEYKELLSDEDSLAQDTEADLMSLWDE